MRTLLSTRLLSPLAGALFIVCIVLGFGVYAVGQDHETTQLVVANQEVEIWWSKQWQRETDGERIPQGYRLFKEGERRHPVGRVADMIAKREKPMHTYTPFRIGNNFYVGYDELHHATFKKGGHVSGEFRGVSVFIKDQQEPSHSSYQPLRSTLGLVVLRSPEYR